MTSADHQDGRPPLKLTAVEQCVCGSHDAKQIGAGLDFEYHTSTDTFLAMQCSACGCVYLNPRPHASEFERIYPATYHSLAFSEENFSFVHKVRSRLEARRLMRYCESASPEPRILDVGCGDGFHLRLLRDHAPANWTLEGMDLDRRAVENARRHGLLVYEGKIDDNTLPENSFDVVYTLQTIEHVEDPNLFLAAIYRVLKPGGRLVIVTDNTGSIDFTLFRRRYWGGYHFPRHFHLFNVLSLRKMSSAIGFETDKITTIVSPVNWVYSIHNALVGLNAPAIIRNRFTLKSPVSLGAFTILDMVLQLFNRGALLNAYFRKPMSPGTLQGQQARALDSGGTRA